MDFKLEVWVVNTLLWTSKEQLIFLLVQDLVLHRQSLQKDYMMDSLNCTKSNQKLMKEVVNVFDQN